MKSLSILSALLLFSLVTSCGITDPVVHQPGSFITVFGGTGNDEGVSVRQTSDGGYILLGTTSIGTRRKDFYLVKTDASGVEQWSRIYGGPGGSSDSLSDETGSAVRQTADGGYIMVGSTTSIRAAGATDILLIKTDADGDTSWTRLYGGPGEDFGATVEQMPDGGYVVGASSTIVTSTDLCVIRTDAVGEEIWREPVDGVKEERCTDLVRTRDGGFVAIGTIGLDLPSVKPVLGKVDASGGTIGLLLSPNTPASGQNAIVELADGSFMTLGYATKQVAGTIDSLFFRKFSSDLKPIVPPEMGEWRFGRKGASRGYSLVQTSDGGFAGLGYARGIGDAGADFYLVRIDSVGTLVWEKTFGGGSEDIGRSLVRTSDGGFAMLGVTRSFVNGENGTDMMLVKVGPDGNLE